MPPPPETETVILLVDVGAVNEFDTYRNKLGVKRAHAHILVCATNLWGQFRSNLFLQ